MSITLARADNINPYYMYIYTLAVNVYIASSAFYYDMLTRAHR